jgi:hypothetical protein
MAQRNRADISLAERSRVGPTGLLNWVMIGLVVLGSIPGVFQAFLRAFDLRGVARPSFVPPGWDIVSGVLSIIGPLLAVVPLLVASFRKAIPVWLKLALWALFLTAIAGLLLFGEDLSEAFAPGPR